MLEVVRSGLVGLVFTLPMMAAADTLTYAVTDESWVPYWMVDDGQVSGVLSDVMHALDERLVVDLQAARPAPPLRAQKMFRDGQVQLECCVSQQWRTAPEQVEVTLWTEPVLEAHEVLVFAPGHAFAFTQLADLRGKTIATVRGYGYAGSEYFRRHDSPDAIALLYKVAHGRSQAGIIDRLELAYTAPWASAAAVGRCARGGRTGDQQLRVAHPPTPFACRAVAGAQRRNRAAAPGWQLAAHHEPLRTVVAVVATAGAWSCGGLSGKLGAPRRCACHACC